MDMITITWTIEKGLVAPVPAVGRVRWHLPLTLADDEVIYGAVTPTEWQTLDGLGAGSITMPDPRQDGIVPGGWLPEVEVDTDAWKARYPVHIPEDEAGPFTLQYLSPVAVDAAQAVVYVRGPKGETGATGPQGVAGATGAAGAPGTPGAPGADGSDGAAGPQGPTGPAGADGVLKAYTTTGLITGTFGPAGDSGAWTMCPADYRSEPIAAEVGDVLRWNPAFFHQSDQESMGDLASVVGGAPARYLSSGTAVQGAVGDGALYLTATHGRTLRAVEWVVDAADIEGGMVTLAFMYRNSGSGNTMGHATLPGRVNVTNMGQGA